MLDNIIYFSLSENTSTLSVCGPTRFINDIKDVVCTYSLEARNRRNLYINSLYSRSYSNGFFLVPSAMVRYFLNAEKSPLLLVFTEREQPQQFKFRYSHLDQWWRHKRSHPAKFHGEIHSNYSLTNQIVLRQTSYGELQKNPAKIFSNCPGFLWNTFAAKLDRNTVQLSKNLLFEALHRAIGLSTRIDQTTWLLIPTVRATRSSGDQKTQTKIFKIREQ